jgi:hypothetical protein
VELCAAATPSIVRMSALPACGAAPDSCSRASRRWSPSTRRTPPRRTLPSVPVSRRLTRSASSSRNMG